MQQGAGHAHTHLSIVLSAPEKLFRSFRNKNFCKAWQIQSFSKPTDILPSMVLKRALFGEVLFKLNMLGCVGLIKAREKHRKKKFKNDQNKQKI